MVPEDITTLGFRDVRLTPVMTSEELNDVFVNNSMP
jgi:hypothetical protein